MTPFYNPEGVAFFDRWAPRVLWKWFPGAALMAVFVAHLTQWQVFIWAAWLWLIIHSGVLIVENWQRPWVRPLMDMVVGWAVGLFRVVTGRERAYAHRYERTAHEDNLRQAETEIQTTRAALLIDTPEADMQIAAQRAAYNDEIERLRLVPKRTRAEEQQLIVMERAVREIDASLGRVASPEMLSTPIGLFGPVAQTAPRGFMGPVSSVVSSIQLWAMGGLAAWGLFASAGWWVTDLRADRANMERDEAQANAERAIEAIEVLRQANREQGELLAATRNQVAETARVIERTQAMERQAARARRARENAIREIIVGSDSPAPDWGLRESEPVSGSAASDGTGEAGAGDPS